MPTDQVRIRDYIFNRRTGRLYRGAYDIRLPEQAIRVLHYFTEHPGKVISRDDLARVLWPEETFTEYSQGINNVISRLRKTFRDSSEAPLYIETIPKRGYRLLPDIENLPDETETPPLGSLTMVELDQPLEEATEEPPPFQLATAPPEAPHEVPVIAATAHRGWWPYLVAALLLALATLAGWLWPRKSLSITPAAKTPTTVSIAVAPFETADNYPAEDPLADSFRVDLIEGLSKLPGMEVQAMHSIRRAPQQAGISSDDAGQLRTENILYTKLHRQGEKYLFDLELVHLSDARHLASWHYEGTTDQLGVLRRQIEDSIFTQLHGSAADRHAMHGGTDSPQAYEQYLHGRFHARQRLPESLKAAVLEYNQAIAADPNFADAYSGLAETNMALGDYGVADRMESYAKAEALCRKAIQLDPTLASAHAQLGMVLFRRSWQFDAGIAELEQAIRLDSSNATHHMWLSTMLTQLRSFDEAAKEIEAARKDDPFWPAVYGNEAYLEANAHQFEKLSHTIDTLTAMQPGWSGSYDMRAWADWLSGNYHEAIINWRRMAVMDKDEERMALEDRGLEALKAGGPTAYARLRLAVSLDGKPHQHQDSDFQAPEWYAYAGQYENALRALDGLVASHSMNCLELAVDAAYAPMYEDPRFLALLARVGFPHSHFPRNTGG